MFAGAEALLFVRAKELRKQQTFAEDMLWNYLKHKPFGFKFRRQHPYSHYILDFYCHRLKLVIEVDGSIHNLPHVQEQDKTRQRFLEEDGLKVIRFTNTEVKKNLDVVICTINDLIRSRQIDDDQGCRLSESGGHNE